MESGKRPVPDRIARRVTHLLNLPATALPFSGRNLSCQEASERTVEEGLARLGYPWLAYRRKRTAVTNPADLLLTALSLDDLDPRLAEGLPWLLINFEGFDSEGLVSRAKAMDLQNRLGFTVTLAREVAENDPLYRPRLDDLRSLERVLDHSRLAREDSYGRVETSARMRAWLLENRSSAAEHWNLLTDLKAEHLPYGHRDSRAVAELPS